MVSSIVRCAEFLNTYGGLERFTVPSQKTTWKDWYAHTATASTAREIITEIRAETGLPLTGDITIGPHASNTVYFVGERFVVKVYCPLFPGDVLSEYEALQILESASGLPVPKVIHQGRLDSAGWHYLILTRQPGGLVGDCWGRLTRQQKAGLVRELARIVRQIHIVSQADVSAQTLEAWRRFLRERISACASSRRWQTFQPSLQKQMHSFIESVGERVDESARLSLLHADINRQHVLTRRVGTEFRISGLIDFGDARFGDAVYDFVGIYVGFCGLCEDYFAVFTDTYGGDLMQAQWFRDRWMLYALIHPHLKFGARLSRNIDLSTFGSIQQLQSYLFD